MNQENDWKDEIIASEGYSQNELNEAFKKVQKVDNWKMPTKRLVVATLAEADLISRAITWFTGGVPTIKAQKNGWAVSATRGYYHFIGA